MLDGGSDTTGNDRAGHASDEVDLLARIRVGDANACAALVRQHTRSMLAVARRLLSTEEDSADAVQDAFLSAFRSLKGFEGQSTLGTWLQRIVVNVCLMKRRAQSRSRQIRMDPLPTIAAEPCPEQPLTQLIRAETRAQVRACIDRLPDPLRAILLLRDLQELDTEQTARLLGIKPGAVKTRLHRARRALRAFLELLDPGYS
jgi:RNA polymerase sigma-70 factor (ECF subfamily)